ncbi:MAG: hypothetical protein MUP14_05450 [Dehalococcoidia bacterium]|nr:hypothetical protein [Dehalococcoidia bacterium]
MRTKKTIRKMTPLARRLAHLTRAMNSCQTRLANITEEVQRLEWLAAAATEELDACETERELMRATCGPSEDDLTAASRCGCPGD